jgi:hypothetical protein
VVGDWANLSAPTAIRINMADGMLTGGADRGAVGSSMGGDRKQ